MSLKVTDPSLPGQPPDLQQVLVARYSPSLVAAVQGTLYSRGYICVYIYQHTHTCLLSQLYNNSGSRHLSWRDCVGEEHDNTISEVYLYKMFLYISMNVVGVSFGVIETICGCIVWHLVIATYPCTCWLCECRWILSILAPVLHSQHRTHLHECWVFATDLLSPHNM